MGGNGSRFLDAPGAGKKKGQPETGSFYSASCTPAAAGFFFLRFLFVCLMWAIFKVFIDFVAILLHFMFCFFGHEACGILAHRVQTHIPYFGSLKS